MNKMDGSRSPLVFVCGHRKCGTTLLVDLLDGHPQLAVYPHDLVILYAYFPEFIRVHHEPAERRARLQRVLFANLAERLARRARLHSLDVAALERRFFEDIKDDELSDMRALIDRLMAAFQAVTGRAVQETRFGVLKETSVEIYADEIFSWFPDARFIQILRDPRDNFAALCAGIGRYYSRLGEDRNRTLASLLHRARIGFRMALRNRSEFGPTQYHILRFENLAAAPEPAMRAIADFLGVNFDASLLTPTQLGLPSGGNNFDGEAMFSISERNVGRWRERITREDAQVIEFHLAEEMMAFGYEPEFAPGEQARAAAEFYKWQNYAYYYSDRFA